ncbi:uncharacterized protein EI90DRAFT_3120073 [Cantharellus anzutake]|uniref:uncharacterized protein n=1 Tax=Cantharellus anzutake TaxID=1750568 RepID=UPI0019072401|nr:uncharacterized protein EI90DRAFT_3120073 [Cantharellus anzutake]KAF8335800.1 hypothetical protein EI90DRAFT_3120073 [Cantharellus anzutake]
MFSKRVLSYFLLLVTLAMFTYATPVPETSIVKRDDDKVQNAVNICANALNSIDITASPSQVVQQLTTQVQPCITALEQIDPSDLTGESPSDLVSALTTLLTALLNLVTKSLPNLLVNSQFASTIKSTVQTLISTVTQVSVPAVIALLLQNPAITSLLTLLHMTDP